MGKLTIDIIAGAALDADVATQSATGDRGRVV